MKLLQSYWSLPSLFNKENESYGRNKGGWLHERYHAMSWALSCLRFKQLYGQIILYTDSVGLDWLGHQLGLPYSEIIVELDSLNRYNPMLWALSKVYVYGRQKEPFIHCDGDVFMWQRPSQQFECSDLICQNLEYNSAHYIEPLKQINEEFSYLPECLRIPDPENSQFISINAGVIGGMDYRFYHNFSANVFSLIDANSSVLDRINLGKFNLIYEQLFCYLLAKQNKLNIVPLFAQVSEDFEEVIRINTTPMFNTYAHMVGNGKQNLTLCMEIEARLKYEFPLVYQHISTLYTTVISHTINSPKKDESAGPTTLAFGHSREFLSRIPIPVDVTSNSIAEIAELLADKTSGNSNDERLFVDLYQIESAWQDLNDAHKSGKRLRELWMEKICSGLDVLYEDRNAFLQKNFVLDTQSYKIICISHRFECDVDHEYLTAVTSGQVSVPLTEVPDIILVEDYDGKIKLTQLEGWDILLYYFEDNPITGLQLIELIKSGQTPFTAEEGEIENDVTTFLINNAFNLRRLRCS